MRRSERAGGSNDAVDANDRVHHHVNSERVFSHHPVGDDFGANLTQDLSECVGTKPLAHLRRADGWFRKEERVISAASALWP